MDFLTICQKVHQEASEGAGPVSVVGQTGELKKVIDYVNLAWLELQSHRTDWFWMRKTKTFLTINGVAEYTQASLGVSVKRFFPETCRIYKTADGKASEGFLSYIDYADWLQRYGAGVSEDAAPSVFTVSPSKSIILTPAPSVGFTLTVDYQENPTEMTENDEVPGLPLFAHRIIVFAALMHYAFHLNASEVYQRAEIGFDKWLALLEEDQLPQITIDETPLA